MAMEAAVGNARSGVVGVRAALRTCLMGEYNPGAVQVLYVV